jgi:RNA polymerase sigma-70 factor (ECF subfamily)
VIRFGVGGHEPSVQEAGIMLPADANGGPTVATGDADQRRLRAMVAEHLDFTWRSLRRLGLPADVADDATQRVFLVASRKLGCIEAGCERAFLFNTAVRVASAEKRTFARRREVLGGTPEAELRDAAPTADELVDRRRARALLEELLASLEMDLRAVFVLFELEGLTTAEIAGYLGIPKGTAASRLRRAREEFQAALKRRQAQGLRARTPRQGGTL